MSKSYLKVPDIYEFFNSPQRTRSTQRIVVMFVMVAIMASIFQGSVNRNGGMTEELMDQTNWKSPCSGWCLETCLKDPGFDDDLYDATPPVTSCEGYWCNCSDMV